MENHEYQKQHRISQIYLKQFGYEKDGNWWVSVYRKGTGEICNIEISNFTTEINIFDLPFQDMSDRRHFEISSALLENDYRTVISNLQNQGQLTTKNKRLLYNFIPNLLCRTEPFRGFINALLKSEGKRDLFIKEITLLSGDISSIKDALELLNVNFQLNVAIGVLMNHLVSVLENFKCTIIKADSSRGVITTDNPILLDKQGNHQWLVPIESEIYFPLSRDYCLFMYHDYSEIKINPLRNLKTDKVNTVEFALFEGMTKKITENLHEYMIFPKELESGPLY